MFKRKKIKEKEHSGQPVALEGTDRKDPAEEIEDQAKNSVIEFAGADSVDSDVNEDSVLPEVSESSVDTICPEESDGRPECESGESEETEGLEESAEGSEESVENAIDAYMEGADVSREDIDEALHKMKEIAAVSASGKFNAGCVEFMLRALHYDSALEKARMEGIIEGRNQQIVESFRDIRAKEGEEIPLFHGMAGIGSGRKEETIFDIAKKAK